MIILDTNLVSELMRADPHVAVLRWVDRQPTTSLFVTVITEAELRDRLALISPGARHARLLDIAERMVAEDFNGRVLPFDRAAAAAYANLATARRGSGRPISKAEAQIAAIAHSRRAALATRNTKDFEACGLKIFKLWLP